MRNLFAIALLLLSFIDCGAQRTSRISRPCSGTATPAKLEVETDGDINLAPCSGRDVTLNGLSIANGFTVSGDSRTTYFPYFSTQTNLTKSPLSWDGSAFNFNNTAGTAAFTLSLTTSAAGRFRVGDFVTTPSTYLDVNQAGVSVYFQSTSANTFDLGPSGLTTTNNGTNWTSNGNINFRNNQALGGSIVLDSGATGNVILGDYNNDGDGTRLLITADTETFQFNSDGPQGATFLLDEVSMFLMNRTNTPAGTTGNRTINKPAGTVNLAAGADQVSVTNSLATTSSLIFAVKRSNDATCDIDNVVAAAGAFIIRMTAACTAETSVGFLVLN